MAQVQGMQTLSVLQDFHADGLCWERNEKRGATASRKGDAARRTRAHTETCRELEIMEIKCKVECQATLGLELVDLIF